MDFPPVIAELSGMLSWLTLAALLLGLPKSSCAKGYIGIGEIFVHLTAHQHLDKQIYRRLHNVTLDKPQSTMQIDHVFLSIYDIFVLEATNMSGWIFSIEKPTQWIQKLYKRIFKLQNPLRKNYKLFKDLEATQDISFKYLYSVIIFVSGSIFKTEESLKVSPNSFQKSVSARLKSPPCCKSARAFKRSSLIVSVYKTSRYETTLQKIGTALTAVMSCGYSKISYGSRENS